MRIAGTVQDSIVDGPGFRFVLFTQGCPHHCEGCQNPQTHDPEGGTEIAVDGLFILRNAVAPGTLVPGLETDGPHIVAGRGQETNLPGIFAAGDCTGRPYQIAKAVGEGNIAAHAMLEYLAKE